MRVLLHLLAALHRRGFHPAVLAGLIMMPAVVAVGYLTDHVGPAKAANAVSTVGAADLRGALDDRPAVAPRAPVAF